MRVHYTAQQTLLSGLWQPKMGGNSPKEEICVYASLIHCALQLKLTQHCKATVPQKKFLKTRITVEQLV